MIIFPILIIGGIDREHDDDGLTIRWSVIRSEGILLFTHPTNVIELIASFRASSHVLLAL